MARPDIKEERRGQILDAFATCVARYGVAGATLARTAEEAGLARPLIRHNVGNRKDLLGALLERLEEADQAWVDQVQEALPETGKLPVLLDLLLDPPEPDVLTVRVFTALTIGASESPELRAWMAAWIEGFAGFLRGVIEADHPEASSELVEAVAAGITAIYFNTESLRLLGEGLPLHEDSRRAAVLLCRALGEAS